MLAIDSHSYNGGRSRAYNAFPVILRMPNGKLIVTFYKGFAHPGAGSRGHVVMRVSSDNGLIWSGDKIIKTKDGKDLRFGAAGVTSTGRIIISYPIYDNKSSVYESVQYIYSDDEGNTWSSPQALPMGGFPYGQIIEIGGGLLGVSTYSGNRAQFATSADNGETWGSGVNVIAPDAGKGYSEASFAYLGSDNIVGLIRQNSGTTFRQVLSQDNGSNWSDQGDTLFDDWAIAGPAWLTPYSSSGVLMVRATYQDRTELKLRYIDASASDIIANGVSAWQNDTRTDVSVLNTSLSGYPSIIKTLGIGVLYNETAPPTKADICNFVF